MTALNHLLGITIVVKCYAKLLFISLTLQNRINNLDIFNKQHNFIFQAEIITI